MSNATFFSIKIPVQNAAQAHWLDLSISSARLKPEQEFSVNVLATKDSIYVSNLLGDDGDPAIDEMTDIIEGFQKHFNLDSEVSFTWANVPSKPSEGVNAGGVIIYKGVARDVRVGDELNMLSDSRDDWYKELKEDAS